MPQEKAFCMGKKAFLLFLLNSCTHTHTHAEREPERESERGRRGKGANLVGVFLTERISLIPQFKWDSHGKLRKKGNDTFN